LVKVKSAALEPISWTLVRVKVALPSLVKVADRGELVLPTLWLGKMKVVGFKEKAAVAAGMSSVLPAPPQDMDHKPTAMQAMAKIVAFSRQRRGSLAFIANASMACASPHCDGLFVASLSLGAPIQRAAARVLVLLRGVHGTEVLHRAGIISLEMARFRSAWAGPR
jgi:hypothetical protein